MFFHDVRAKSFRWAIFSRTQGKHIIADTMGIGTINLKTLIDIETQLLFKIKV